MMKSMTQTVPTAAEPSHRKATVPERKKGGVLAVFFLALAVLLVAVPASGVCSRSAATAELQQRTDQAAALVVRVAHTEKDPGVILLHLLCLAMPCTDVSIFAAAALIVALGFLDMQIGSSQARAVPPVPHNQPWR